MSVVVGGLRRRLTGAVPRIPSVSASWLLFGFGAGLAVYLALKLLGAIVALPAAVDLAIMPAGICALALALRDRHAEVAAAEEAERGLRSALLAGLILSAFAITYIALNTVPMASSVDEKAILSGAHEVATTGSLRVTNPLNERYHTNIIGALDVSYRTPNAMYHRVFPGTALGYAPFSLLPGDAGYYLYTALFGTAAIIALYLLAWKLLRSWWAALLAGVMFLASPAFGHWAVAVFNNVPVLSLELSALTLIVWSTPPRGWQLALAGVMMALAVFMRVTELVFVLPMLALVWWRCRAWRPCLPFAVAASSCAPLVLVTNLIFFHNPFFFAHVGLIYRALGGSARAGSSPGLFERYVLYVFGVSGSISNFHPLAALHNMLYHAWYLGSSTFAFPFLALSFSGIAWWLVAGRRHAWLLASAVCVAAAAIVFVYGRQHDNYYGYGLPIARSSFVRYSLLVYALLAIAGGAFLLEAARVSRVGGAVSSYSSIVLLALIGGVGIMHSYDANVYGFNRLNYMREHDRTAWQAMDEVLAAEREPPLVIVGTNSLKLVDSDRYPDTINYGILRAESWDRLLFPVVSEAQHDRGVYLAVSASQPESAAALSAFEERYAVERVARSGSWALYSVEPPIVEASP